MKLTVIIMMISCFHISAKSYSQSLNLTGKDIPLAKALTMISEQSGHYLFYKYNELKDAEPVTIKLKNASLTQALKEVFKNQPFTFAIEQKTIVVTKVIGEAPKAPVFIDIKGRVLGDKGTPLPGAGIRVKNGSQTAVTDANGNFSLNNLPENSVIVVSYVGYVTQEIAIGNRTNITVTLLEDAASLNTLVVVGYGKQERKDITGSISSIDSKKIQDQAVVSLDNAMAGQMAGVQVTAATGAPGGGATVRVRGAGSLSAGNEPLYVVDGFPVTNDFNQRNNPLNTINPSDIDNIQVLKDASATAIYGSRGSNGVVIITTKSGKSGVSKIDFSLNTGVQQVEKTLDVLNAREFALFVNEARNNAWVNSGAGRSTTDPNSARLNNVMYLLPASLSNPDALGEGTNWQDEIFRSAPMSNYQINFSGGNEKTKYFVSGGYLSQDGVVLGSDLKRYSFRVNVESQVNKVVKVGANITPSYTFSNQTLAEGNWQGGGIIQSALTAGPHMTPYNADGSYTKITGLGIGTSEVDNPVKIAREYFHQQSNMRLLGTAYAEANIISGLTLKALVGADIRSFREQIFNPSIINPNSVNDTKLATGNSNTSENRNWLAEFTLNYNKKINKHAFDGLLGYTIQQENIEANAISATNFPNDQIKTVNAAGTITSAPATSEAWALLSYLARVNYSYDNKYLLTATLRTDGSSRFGFDNRYGVFPSVSLGWRISEENFMKNVNWISDLKLKTSYGITGNNFISNYGAIALTTTDNYIFGASGGTVNNGIRLANIANSLLSWEKNKQLDIGLEFGILKNRVSMSLDYYNKRTSDLLLNVPTPTLTGYTNALQNIGEIQNKGFEVSVTSRNFVNAFKWTTDFNISTNKIKVLALGPDGSRILSRQTTFAAGNTHITEIGAAPGSFFGYKVIGVYRDQNDVDNSAVIRNANGTVSSKPGQLKFADIDGDGVITADDRTGIGSPFPDFTYGMTNSFAYKGFDFSFTLQGVQGFQVLNAARRFYGNYAGSYNVLRSTANGWVSPSSPGDGFTPQIDRNFGALGIASVVNNATSAFVEDGSFLRIRNITLGYNLPASVAKSLKVANARLSFTIQNAFTFTNYEGYNPEVSVEGANPLMPGVDSGGYPLARTFMFGLNFGF
ncbi:MAG: TonB-dependent receptor [Pedobacter sp.]|uniref:TonB-dependent receptor n=1 Tax=Pedobacter sp. TaxID=1411316 RepID=UPI002807B85B|nr:TonB-dependent receptor [Pedobacter sp.]MDQ8005890.1 TonB-dependent receptor [Pedobacter sp.]